MLEKDKVIKNEIKYNDFIMFFSEDEMKYLTKSKTVKRVKDKIEIKHYGKFWKYYDKVIAKSWIQYSKKPRIPNKLALFPKLIDKQIFGSDWLIEIQPYKSIDYQATLSINIKVGYKRLFSSQIFVNPKSRNLKNFELFQTTVNEIEESTHFINDLMEDLFSFRQLALYERESSLTIEDMLSKEKSNYSYLQRIFYLFVTHNIITDQLQFATNHLNFFSHAGNINLKTKLKGILKSR